MANFSAIWQLAAHTTHNHPLAAQQEPFKKQKTLTPYQKQTKGLSLICQPDIQGH